MNQKNNIIQLTYYDDGNGFNLENELRNKKGMGLNNILSRLNTIGGNYNFITIPEKGIWFKIGIDLTLLQ